MTCVTQRRYQTQNFENFDEIPVTSGLLWKNKCYDSNHTMGSNAVLLAGTGQYHKFQDANLCSYGILD